MSLQNTFGWPETGNVPRCLKIQGKIQNLIFLYLLNYVENIAILYFIRQYIFEVDSQYMKFSESLIFIWQSPL